MTLIKLREYYELRVHQVHALEMAQGRDEIEPNDQYVYWFLIQWAVNMYEADEIQNSKGFILAASIFARGEA